MRKLESLFIGIVFLAGLILILSVWKRHHQVSEEIKNESTSTEIVHSQPESQADEQEENLLGQIDVEDIEPVKKSSNFSPDVRWFLASKNRDVSKMFLNPDKSTLQKAERASLEILTKLVDCLAERTDCRYKPKDGEPYYFVGGPAVYQAIERSLDFYEMSVDSGQHFALAIVPPKEILEKAINLPSERVSSTAAILLYRAAQSSAEKRTAVQKARQLRAAARGKYLEYVSFDNSATDNMDPIVEQALEVEIEASVAEDADEYTKSEVVKRLDRFGLNEEQFRRMALRSCRSARGSESQSSIRGVLSRKARSAGFQLTAEQMCTEPNRAEGI